MVGTVVGCLLGSALGFSGSIMIVLLATDLEQHPRGAIFCKYIPVPPCLFPPAAVALSVLQSLGSAPSFSCGSGVLAVGLGLTFFWQPNRF
jgi:hypothetical protein